MSDKIKKIDDKTKNVQVQVSLLRAGSSFGYDLFDEFGNSVLEAHTPIEEAHIRHLLSAEIEFLYYDPTASKAGAPAMTDSGLNVANDMIGAELKSEIVDHTRDLLEHIREIYNYSPGATISKEKISSSRQMVEKILKTVDENKDGVYESLSSFRNLDEYHYHHSTNVSILSAILGARLDLNRTLREGMGLGALFHDIGMSSISKEIINKVEKLSREEFDVIRGHPHVGYKFIEKNPAMQEFEKRIVLLHHEKTDGSGYPYGFDMDHIQTQLPRGIRLVALCDVYTALVLRRPPNPNYSSREALRLMLNMVYAPYKKFHQFLPADFRDFIRGLGFIVNKGNFFMNRGDLVRLNTGEVAIIEEMSKLYPMNPRVRVLKDRQMQNLKRPIQIDLLKDYQSYIANVFDRTKDSKTVSVKKIDESETM